ncbi:MAG: DNA polymerase III subunit delta [Spirochaetaceae bacterium]|jgi:DNA polymerase-3 subunit delta|nr:DNA polymerase III subunit delta [Spirochaetaceae bacterium]
MAKGTCLLFLGPEIGEKQDAINEIRRNMTRKTGAPPEETSFYAGETALPEILSQLRNGSLFSDSRLVFIKSAEVYKKKEEIESLAAYIRAPQTDTTLILMSENSSLAKGLEGAFTAGTKRIFWELFENRKTEWVEAFFIRAGYRVGEEAVETILEMVENNTDALGRECSRLMLFLDKEKPVTARDVEEWLSHTREESAFSLFSRIARGDLSKSVEILHTLLAAKQPSISVLAGLTWCFRKLRDYLHLSQSGWETELELKKIGLGSSKVRRDYVEAARLFSEADTALSLIAEFEVLLRSSGSALELILWDLLLYRLIRNPDHPREKWMYY